MLRKGGGLAAREHLPWVGDAEAVSYTHLDVYKRQGGTSASPDIIVFPFNPETLSRTIQPAPQAPDSGEPSDATGSPQETIVFTLTLDATDALEQSDQQAATMGVYPVLTAIELLMYPQARDLNVVTLFVWGPYRVVPVRILSLIHI